MENEKENLWHNYIALKGEIYSPLLRHNYTHNLISEANWVLRAKASCGEEIGIAVKPGDICYMDFGQSYLNEMGYQHFGLVMSICNKKALVIPMTSNQDTYASAYDPVDNPNGKRNLMRIGLIHGLVKPSVLFINDLRYINTARVIQITTSISKRCQLFHDIQNRMKEVLNLDVENKINDKN